MAKAKMFYVRHQAAGIAFDHPFSSPPSQAEVAEVLAACEAKHGTKHPKTGEPYWAKVISVEGGVQETLGCAHGGTAESVDARASGECPIREAGHKRWPDADPEREVMTIDASDVGEVTVSGKGRVAAK